jgi:hypothetical protein
MGEQTRAVHSQPSSPGAADDALWCPSAPPEVGNVVLGAVQPDGRVAYLRTRLQADAATVQATPAGRTADQRFRFAAPCVSTRCRQWVDGACQVPQKLVDLELRAGPRARADDASLPHCSIRHQCRWFAQSGTSACLVCPLVVTRGDYSSPSHPT